VEQAWEQGRRRRPGGGATGKQERFARLIEQGIRNAEACRRAHNSGAPFGPIASSVRSAAATTARDSSAL